VKVVWSEAASTQLHAIHDYIAQHSEFYAKRTVERLTSRTKQIGRFPYSGRRVSNERPDSVREVIEGSYRLIYEVQVMRIVILSVVHTAFNTQWE
jgi:toxin ParE1/3/4